MPARGYRPSTQQENRGIFERLANDLAQRGCTTSEELAKKPAVLDQVVADRLKTQKASTINRDLAKLRAVFNAAVSRRLLDAPPLRDWPRPKQSPAEYREIATPGEIGAFLARLDASPYAAIIRFIALVGCRPVDACQLTIDRIRDGTMSIRQMKTGQPIVMQLSKQAIDVVTSAIGFRTNGPVFLAFEKPIDPNTLCGAIRRYGAGALTAKTLRQSVVSTLLELGYDLETIRRITGHRSNAIAAYMRLRSEHVRTAAEAIAHGFTENADQRKIGVPDQQAPRQ